MAEYNSCKIIHNGDIINLQGGGGGGGLDWECLGSFSCGNPISVDGTKYSEYYVSAEAPGSGSGCGHNFYLINKALSVCSSTSYWKNASNVMLKYCRPSEGQIVFDATTGGVTLCVYGKQKQTQRPGKTGYIDLLVIGGGGSGGVSSTVNCYAQGGGGGAGGYFEDFGFTLYGGETYSIKIGAGGASSTCNGNNGGDTYFRNSLQTINICMCGGGGGGYYNYGIGKNGGSGGGAGYNGSAGSGICGQGHNGNGANGGGAGEDSCGCYSSISGSCVAYAGGGRGMTKCGTGGTCDTDYGCLGWCGCGGGSGGTIGTPKKGRDGVVILRYKTDGSYGILPTSTGGIKYTCGDYTIHCFTDTTTAQCFVPVFK